MWVWRSCGDHSLMTGNHNNAELLYAAGPKTRQKWRCGRFLHKSYRRTNVSIWFSSRIQGINDRCERLQTFSPNWLMPQPECRNGPRSGMDMMHSHLVIY